MQNETIFSKIIRGEIPCDKVYEDEEFFAFLDINPVAKGHTLLMPKAVYERIHDAPDDVIARIFVQANNIIKAMRQTLPCDFVQVVVEGEEVPHFHIHLIPCMHGHKPSQWEHVTYADGEKAVYSQKITAGLQ